GGFAAEACVKGPGARRRASRCAPPRATLSLAPVADAANLAADLGATPLVPTVAVVGLGLMGSSFALALQGKGHTIVGSDRDPAVVLKAVDRRIVEVAHSDLSMVDIADVVVLIESVGSHPVVMSAAAHDKLVAAVSHAAFLLSIGYVLALSHRTEWPEASKVAGSGFRDMSRLAAGDPELYAGIAETNREN